ncbi:hypothetical protein HPP92_013540 [Vanilla planifolia]|uniref:Uncharacterized protein n=1 Tax=Vanilla planifolia TaxID=51239 RepID=A0A835QSI4_VANPL|nr:hypothetical protein HPP92_013540 [Vanilla planifolia]
MVNVVQHLSELWNEKPVSRLDLGPGSPGEYIKRERSQVLVIPTTILQHLPNRNLDIQLDRNVVQAFFNAGFPRLELGVQTCS